MQITDIEEAREEAEEVAEALADLRHMLAGKCSSIVMMGGPHPGCDEFEPPVPILCPNPAEYLVLVKDNFYETRWEPICNYHRTMSDDEVYTRI